MCRVSVSCPVAGIITSGGIILVSAPKLSVAKELFALHQVKRWISLHVIKSAGMEGLLRHVSSEQGQL